MTTPPGPSALMDTEPPAIQHPTPAPFMVCGAARSTRWRSPLPPFTAKSLPAQTTRFSRVSAALPRTHLQSKARVDKMSIVMESLLPFQLPAAPCKPENTSADQNCSSNVMTVRWTHSSTTQNYTVKATSASGVNSTCDTTQSSCSFLDLSCGQLYTFTVMGHTNVCMSEMSTPIQKLTGKLRLFTVENISQRSSSTFLETRDAKRCIIFQKC